MVQWRKSSHSDQHQGACVELAELSGIEVWRKASRSEGSEEGACVELADLSGPHVGLRDSKDPEGPRYALTRSAFRNLLEEVKEGGYGL